MASLSRLREVVTQVLRSQIGSYPVETMRDELIQSKDLNRFLVVCTGWDGVTAYHALIQDVQLFPNGLIHIHADNTDQDLTEALIAAGIPAGKIIQSDGPDQQQQVKQLAAPIPEYRQAA